MLLELIGIDFSLKSSSFRPEVIAPLPFWILAEDPNSFNRLFCMAFMLLESNWIETNATRMDFNRCLRDVKNKMHLLLQCKPRTVDEMWKRWLDSKAEAMLQSDRIPMNPHMFRSSSIFSDDEWSAANSANVSPTRKNLVYELPNLSTPSTIMSDEDIKFLDTNLPSNYQGYVYSCIYV
jgi:hypothetical protein